MSKTQELKEGTEEILRNQFVDRAYSKSGKTTWGVDETRDELIALFTQHADDIRKEAVEGFVDRVCNNQYFAKGVGLRPDVFYTVFGFTLRACAEAYLKHQEVKL